MGRPRPALLAALLLLAAAAAAAGARECRGTGSLRGAAGPGRGRAARGGAGGRREAWALKEESARHCGPWEAQAPSASTHSCLSPFLTEEVPENVSPICTSKAFPHWAGKGTPRILCAPGL